VEHALHLTRVVHAQSALCARTRPHPHRVFDGSLDIYPRGSEHHRLVAHRRVCANIWIQENPRRTLTPFDVSGPRTEHPVCPHPPTSPLSYRRIALCLSPAIRHTISLRSKRQQPPNDIRDCQLRCGASSAAQNVRLFPWHLSPGCYIDSPQKQKRRVSRETHRRFLPTTSPIKPFSSPTRGRFRSRAGSVQARRPALPAQTHPSPAHSRSRRFAAPPAHSARSAASPRPSRAAR
jgi:hypothetical protein